MKISIIQCIVRKK